MGSSQGNSLEKSKEKKESKNSPENKESDEILDGQVRVHEKDIA